MVERATEPRRGVRAAVIREPNADFSIEELELDPPGEREVLVRLVATGMCHTDAAVCSRDLPTPLPVVLGHEGSGIVEAVGPGVHKVAPGDHVVLTVLTCGTCAACRSGHPSMCTTLAPLNFGGARLDGSHALHSAAGGLNDRFFGQSSFATYAVADERNTVKVRKDAPLELLGPLGCGIQTGAGSVLNGLKVAAGQSFCVFGSGAVGLAAVMAARLAGAATIIAVDVVPSRLSLARELGATHVVNSKESDARSAIGEIVGIGLDTALDTTGHVDVIRMGVELLRPGGTCGILGASPPGADLKLDVNDLMANSKCVRGIVEGDAIPDIFIPQLIDLYLQGRFPFDKLVKFYSLDDINAAAADSANGLTIKPIVRMSD
jgi:aryl-alcohol dehydrogenase